MLRRSCRRAQHANRCSRGVREDLHFNPEGLLRPRGNEPPLGPTLRRHNPVAATHTGSTIGHRSGTASCCGPEPFDGSMKWVESQSIAETFFLIYLLSN
jgi:hypothetical protein